MYLQNISQQPAFCVALQTIIEHFQFPSLCNAVTLMRNASQFDQISEIQFRDLIFAQHVLFVLHDVWAK